MHRISAGPQDLGYLSPRVQVTICIAERWDMCTHVTGIRWIPAPAAGADPACQGGGGRRGGFWLPLYRTLPHPFRSLRCICVELLSVQALQGSHTVFNWHFTVGVESDTWFCLSELSDLGSHTAHLPARELEELWLSLGQGRVSPLWEEGNALNVSSVWPISKQPTQGTVCMLFWCYRARNGPVTLTMLVVLEGTVSIFTERQCS